MKGTDQFKKTIEEKLQEMAQQDQIFAEKFKNPSKNIDDCITYILNQVQKSGCAGFADEEIFGMAAHYYDEEKIEVGSKISCNVIVNHSIELTEEEKQLAKKEALNQAIEQERQKLHKKSAPKKPEPEAVQQGSLF